MLQRALPRLASEGFDRVFLLSGPDEIDAAAVIREDGYGTGRARRESAMMKMHGEHGAAGDGAARDPVCGMSVDPEQARAKDLVASYEGREYFFCGRGCKLDFQEDPARYFEPGYQPSM